MKHSGLVPRFQRDKDHLERERVKSLEQEEGGQNGQRKGQGAMLSIMAGSMPLVL